MKKVTFIGSSRDDLRVMPASVRRSLGLELMRVQAGREPLHFKPLASVGAGAYELRARDAQGAFRVIYVAKFAATVYVLHAFQKKTQRTTPADITLAKRRYQLIGGCT